MKKIFAIFILTIFPLIAFAQRGIPRTDNVSVSSTIVTKTHHKRTIKKHDANIGYQNIAEVNYSGIIQNFGVDYIGGWRFNNWLFMGVGIGCRHEFMSTPTTVRENMNDKLYWKGYGDYFIFPQYLLNDLVGEDYLYDKVLNTFAIPVYAHVRTYLSRTKTAPYLSLSLGERFAPKDCGIYFDFSTGLDFRLKPEYHMFISLGFWASKYRDTDIDGFYSDNYRNNHNYDFKLTTFEPYEYCDSDCEYDYIQHGHYHIDFFNFFKIKETRLGFSVKLGFSF